MTLSYDDDCVSKMGKSAVAFTPPEGSSISGLEGRVGTQGMGFYGGAHQVYLDYRAVPSDWIEITTTNWER
ncbi:hypothetical protein [Lachnobacterium bovis]|uniref:hypothetical protein n=1 Tax=Lachnobacterium bovis TaxID=140626 RepID=UPI0004914D5E|nr:hypothetical protein [Lachnobacterium bovis]